MYAQMDCAPRLSDYFQMQLLHISLHTVLCLSMPVLHLKRARSCVALGPEGRSHGLRALPDLSDLSPVLSYLELRGHLA